MVFSLVTIIDGFDEICILIMIHKLDGKLISKAKKEEVIIIVIVVVLVKYLAFIFGSHFAYSSIKIGFKLHTHTHTHTHTKFYNTFNTFSFRYSTFSFSYSTFSKKISVSAK